jgi:hypothetical protein
MATGNGIQWLMELDAKLDGARAMVKELKESEAAADAADRAFKKVEEGFSIKGMWKEYAKWDILKEGIAKATEMVKGYAEAVWHTIELAAGSERTGKVFENMLGKNEGRETLEYLDEFAKLSEFTDDAIKPLAAELLRAGLRGTDFKNALGAAVDVAAEAPNKMEGLSEAIASLSRISLSGKVDARTLRGLRLNPHDVADQLSKDLELPKKTIEKQLETGAINGAKAMQSIFTVMERKTGMQLGGRGFGMKDNLEATIEKLKDIPEEIAKKFKDTQGYADISDSLGRFVQAFNADSRFGSMMTKNLDWIGAKLKAIDWDEVSTKLGKIVDDVKQWGEMMQPVVSALREAADIVEKIPTVFGYGKNPNAGKGTDEEREELQRQMGGFMQGLAQHQDDTVGKIADLKTQSHGKLGDEEIAERLGLDLSVVRSLGIDAGRRLSDGIDAGIRDSFPKLDAASHAAVIRADDGVRDQAEIRSPSHLFARHGELMAAGLAEGLRRGGEVVYDAAASIIPTPNASDLQGAPSGGAGGGFHAGGVEIHLTFQIQGGASASANDIVEQAQAMLPDALQSALEQAAIQAGLA